MFHAGNKRFLNLAVGVLGSTYNDLLLWKNNVYDEIIDGKVLHNKVINLRADLWRLMKT